METIEYLVYGTSNKLSRVVHEADGKRRYEIYGRKDGKFGWYKCQSVEDAWRDDRWDWWPVSEEDVPELIKKEQERIVGDLQF